MMTFTYQHKDAMNNLIFDITYNVYGDESIDAVMQDFRQFLLAASYAPATVDKYIQAE